MTFLLPPCTTGLNNSQLEKCNAQVLLKTQLKSLRYTLNAPGEKLSRFLKMAGVGLGFSLFSYNNSMNSRAFFPKFAIWEFATRILTFWACMTNQFEMTEQVFNFYGSLTTCKRKTKKINFIPHPVWEIL